MNNTDDILKNYRGKYSQYWIERWGLIPELPTSFDNANSIYELVAWLQRAFKNLLDDFQQLESEFEDFRNALIDLLEYLIPELIRRYHDSEEFRVIFITLLKDILAGEERNWVKDLLKELLEVDMRAWIEDYLKTLYGLKLNEITVQLTDTVASESRPLTYNIWSDNTDRAINIKWFGAKGNANYKNEIDKNWYEDSAFTILANDDSLAIQTAIKFAQFGGKVFAPKGNYWCSVKVSWDGGNIDFPSWNNTNYRPKNFIFEGVGSNTKFIAKNEYALKFEYASMMAGTLRTFERMHFRDFQIDGDKQKYGIYLKACSSVRFDNIQIKNTGSDTTIDTDSSGLHMIACGMFRINNYQYASGGKTSAIHAMENSSDSFINDVDIQGSSTGICITDSGQISIHGGVIYANSTANIRLRAIRAYVPSIRISNVELEPSGSGKSISICDGSSDRVAPYTALHLDIYDNNILMGENGGGSGIVASHLVNSNIHDNLFSPYGNGIGANQIGMYFKTGCSQIQIHHNKFYNILAYGIGLKVDFLGNSKIESNNVSIMENVETAKFMEINDGTALTFFGNWEKTYSTNAYFMHVKKIIPGAKYVYNTSSGAKKDIMYDTYNEFFEPEFMHRLGGFHFRDHSWDRNPLRLGSYYLWVDPTGKLRIKNGKANSAFDGTPFSLPDYGPTGSRPNTNLKAGFSYFDVTINKPIWYNGAIWVDSKGVQV